MQTLVSTVVKAEAVPSSDQYQNHQLFLSEGERSAVCKADRIIQVEKAESFLYFGGWFGVFLVFWVFSFLACTEWKRALAFSS